MFTKIIAATLLNLPILLPAPAYAVPIGDSDGPFSGPAGDGDASAFWVDVSPYARGTISDAAQLGQTICGALQGGQSEGKVIAEATQGDQSEVLDAEFVVHAAEWHFCPQFY
ncbi:hypothetical protein MTER_32860 [Mycolicibacter terrae]|jgi:hypothetical protein|uniref:DUF732 domain-containing protein n=1 Tax=Mycolicibacter terrae TaxID=1788 RepID=A0AAD1MJ63_9MYCO|nr:DUF732 domain-containing protein [Mycolicibacter terrae]ORW98298.1 hypothetical protein AWC28_06970 [Mycolicibacter terrae]BBX23875.1 hypothetical protein MTER_32860 [Mycolicibacter terrae]SNV59039.1 Uncharacterised protein [Mycolicibacter terrae]